MDKGERIKANQIATPSICSGQALRFARGQALACSRLAMTMVIGLILAGCAEAEVAGQGVSGNVLLGPHCPVVQEGEECPDTPFQTKLVVTSTGGMDEIKEFSSDANGMFAVLLPVGEYAIRSPLGATLPFCTSDIFVVTASQMTEITVYCDTGIR